MEKVRPSCILSPDPKSNQFWLMKLPKVHVSLFKITKVFGLNLIEFGTG
jgi:hypothetical protein